MFKVIRDFSEIYQRRSYFEKIPEYAKTHPTFNTYLSIKMVFYEYPSMFISIWIVCSTLMFGYSIYVFEREAQVEMNEGPPFSFWVALFIAMNCTMTGWATDTFGLYNLVTWPGKLTAITAVVVGLFLFAVLVEYVHVQMRSNSFQQVAVDWMIHTQLEEKQRQAAARLIQVLYRMYRWKQIQARLLDKNSKKARKKEFTFQFTKAIMENQKVRKEKKKQTMQARDVEADKENELKEAMNQAVDKAVDKLKGNLLKDIKTLLEEERKEFLKQIMKVQMGSKSDLINFVDNSQKGEVSTSPISTNGPDEVWKNL